MHWRCNECGNLLGLVIGKFKETRLAWCSHCGKNTHQAPARVPNYLKMEKRK